MNTKPLRGWHVLVVEDEYMIAEDERRDLEREGAVVVGPVPSVEKALRLIEAKTQIDAAVLDINLGDESSFPIAEALEARAVPFVFATGYVTANVPRNWQHVRVVEKPLSIASIVSFLAAHNAT